LNLSEQVGWSEFPEYAEKLLKEFSCFPNEVEVLFRPNSKLLVTDKLRDGDRWIIKMTEG
jgi:hypothetical protein